MPGENNGLAQPEGPCEALTAAGSDWEAGAVSFSPLNPSKHNLVPTRHRRPKGVLGRNPGQAQKSHLGAGKTSDPEQPKGQELRKHPRLAAHRLQGQNLPCGATWAESHAERPRQARNRDGRWKREAPETSRRPLCLSQTLQGKEGRRKKDSRRAAASTHAQA